jgi:pyruvate/2-oxoglutarate dehydrogenase complex dihydrolipoamide dehydrogenase (E3) component
VGAGAFSDLGAEVTLIAQEPEILPMFDAPTRSA